jgi:nucleotide-binding universal stress UspA family protein
MRRVLVPLDGTDLSAAILPDAMRLAGIGGEIILLVDVSHAARAAGDHHPDVTHWNEYADAYLEPYLQDLQSRGVRVSTHKVWISEPIWVIADMAGYLKVDMIACGTHGRTPFGRLIRGGTAWQVVAHSEVPVLLRHVDGEKPAASPSARPHILVPLDGSAYAEKALPLAVRLAIERHATLALARVATSGLPDWGAANMGGWAGTGPIAYSDGVAADRCYLEQAAASLPVGTETSVIQGSPIAGALTDFVRSHTVTDVVMTTHGRTGLARVVLGSVADSLVHALSCPIILVPALAAAHITNPFGHAEKTSRTPVEVA